MDYIQGIADQTEIFLYALGFGFPLGILYDIFRIPRMIISWSKGFILFLDLFYFAVCTFLTFCFVLTVDSGRIRIYVAAGEILGWLVYYFSFGAIAMRVSNAVVSAFKRVFSAAAKPVRRISGKISRKTACFIKFCKKNIRKSEKKQKYILQKYKGIVYNLLGYTRNRNLKKKGND